MIFWQHRQQRPHTIKRRHTKRIYFKWINMFTTSSSFEIIRNVVFLLPCASAPEIRLAFGVSALVRCCCWFALIWLNDFLSGMLDKYKINRNYSTHSSAAMNAMPVRSEDLKMMWKSMRYSEIPISRSLNFRWSANEHIFPIRWRLECMKIMVDLNGSNCFRRFGIEGGRAGNRFEFSI